MGAAVARDWDLLQKMNMLMRTCMALAVLAAAGLGRSQWPMSSSQKSYILTKAKLHTYVEL